MTTLRFGARPRARFATLLAVVASSTVLLAMALFSACGGSDADDDASKNYIGATDAEPPRLGPRDVDAGPSPSR
jgi:hypothetical protein